MALMDSGTTTAVVPIAVPTTNRVNGMTETSRIRNGNDRTKFTTASSTMYSDLFGASEAGRTT